MQISSIIIIFIIYIFTLIKNDDITDINIKYSKIPKLIWLYWEGDMPNQLPYLLHNLKEIMDNYNIIFINNSTVNNYLNSSTYPPSLYSLPIANQADYYRFYLLYKYGGIWMDSTTYMKDSSYLDDFIKLVEEEGNELGAFNSWFSKPFQIELGFLISYPHTEIMRKIIKEVNYCLKIGRLEYMKKRIKEGILMYDPVIYNNENPKSPTYNTFYCFYVCMQTVVQRYYKYKPPVTLIQSEDTIFKLNSHCKWNVECMVEKFNEDIKREEYPFVIFTSICRNRLSLPKIDII